MLPLMKPALVTSSIFAFIWSWNDFFGPLIYLNDSRKFTLALGLNEFTGLYSSEWHLLMAGDAWLGNAVLEEDAPYHPLGLPYGGMPPDAAAKLGLTLDATPTLDEVLAPRLARMAGASMPRNEKNATTISTGVSAATTSQWPRPSRLAAVFMRTHGRPRCMRARADSLLPTARHCCA